MKAIFPCYASSFRCACTIQEATKRIFESVACQPNNLKIIKADDADIQKIDLSASTGGYVYHNSFMPLVEIGMKNEDDGTQISAIFKLHKSTKVLMTVVFVFALLLEIVLLVHLIVKRAVTSASLCLLPGMMILTYILGAVGLYFSSKGVLKILFEALTGENGKDLPSIHKTKCFKQ